jgi:hypothetical protein
MISYPKVHEQLKSLRINPSGWGHTEYRELCNILHPDEVIEAAVNGYYEAGFALLVITKNRMLIVDKKPLNYLTVEEMRFEKINEFDYQHRLLGAQIKASAGPKTLLFSSLNQVRLRRCVSYAQSRITEIRQEQHSQQEAQQKYLAQMNKQLEMYLQMQQLQQQQYLQNQKYAQDHPTPGYVVQMATAAEPSSHDDTKTVPAAGLTPGQLGIQAMKRVIPVISAYTRLPLMSRQRGSRHSTPPAS